ncbi:MAG: hypothetical protein A3H39_17885 [candidate division NC10 bacterium RIFCSPLOWO2_02_FULL_66_22]|nr:MAG: hypothetical protein A3H39_17885 [candidate division NC10 bacterium RIFCSPLOWO2_02_FULL_66_22]
MDRPIALVVALAQERRPLLRLLAAARQGRADEFRLIVGELAGQTAVLIQAGIGRDRARRALLAAAHRFPVRAAWSLGFSGGLAETLCPGDLVCPAVVLQDDGRTGQSFGVAPAQAAVRAALAAAGIRTHDGPLLTVDDPLRTPEVKRAAHRRTGAVAVDMEAAGVAEAACELGIPWLAIKAVVDAAGEALPEFLAGCTTAQGELRWRGLLSNLASARRRRTLWRLRRASRQAAQGLQRAVDVAFAAWSP